MIKKPEYKSRYNLDHRYGIIPEIKFAPLRIVEPAKDSKYSLRLQTTYHIPEAPPIKHIPSNDNAPPIPKRTDKSISVFDMVNKNTTSKLGSLNDGPEEGKRIVDHTQNMDVVYLSKADQMLLDTKAQGFESSGSTQKWTGGKKDLLPAVAPEYDFKTIETTQHVSNEDKANKLKDMSFDMRGDQIKARLEEAELQKKKAVFDSLKEDASKAKHKQKDVQIPKRQITRQIAFDLDEAERKAYRKETLGKNLYKDSLKGRTEEEIKN